MDFFLFWELKIDFGHNRSGSGKSPELNLIIFLLGRICLFFILCETLKAFLVKERKRQLKVDTRENDTVSWHLKFRFKLKIWRSTLKAVHDFAYDSGLESSSLFFNQGLKSVQSSEPGQASPNFWVLSLHKKKLPNFRQRLHFIKNDGI